MHGLLYALKTQLAKDSTGERARLFDGYLKARPTLALIFSRLDRPRLRAILCLLYGAACGGKLFKWHRRSPLAIYRFANEREKITGLRALLKKHEIKELNWETDPIDAISSIIYFFALGLRYPKETKRVLRTLRRWNTRLELFRVMRLSETLFTYFFIKRSMERGKPGAIVISTEANPHGCALMGAGLRSNVPVVLLTHGAVTARPVKVVCRLGIFYGSHAFEDYSRMGSEISEHFFYGLRKERIVADPQEVKATVFLSMSPNLSAVRQLGDLLKREFKGITLLARCHPASLLPVRKIESQLSPIFLVCSERSLEQDLKGVLATFAGNSTSHLEALSRGVPSLCIPELDGAGAEALSFIREGLVVRGSITGGIREKIAESAALMNSEKWREHFQCYWNTEYDQKEFLRQLDEKLSWICRDEG